MTISSIDSPPIFLVIGNAGIVGIFIVPTPNPINPNMPNTTNPAVSCPNPFCYD